MSEMSVKIIIEILETLKSTHGGAVFTYDMNDYSIEQAIQSIKKLEELEKENTSLKNRIKRVSEEEVYKRISFFQMREWIHMNDKNDDDESIEARRRNFAKAITELIKDGEDG